MSRPLRNLKQGFITIRPFPGFYEPARGYDGLIQPEALSEPCRQDSLEKSDLPDSTTSRQRDAGGT